MFAMAKALGLDAPKRPRKRREKRQKKPRAVPMGPPPITPSLKPRLAPPRPQTMRRLDRGILPFKIYDPRR